ncbi:MAG: hypothetical protein AB8B87_08215 [Granulosicoccus sp.]
MSELQLSAKLVGDIQQLLQEHDAAAADPGVTSQYLCAVVGFLLGQQEMPAGQKDEVMEQLGAFMKHVADDVGSQKKQAAAPPPPPQQQAFGIWKPKS